MGDWIHLDSIEFPCIIGLLEQEQRIPQAVRIDLSLGLDLEGALTGSLSRTVDYTSVLGQVEFITQQGRWRLVESAAGAIVRFLLSGSASGAEISAVRIKLSKPSVFGGRAIPSVEMTRSRSSLELPTFETAGTRTTVLLETALTGAYRVSVAPGAAWSVLPGAAVLVTQGVVHGAGAAHVAGAALARGQAAKLRNDAEEPAVLLVVAQPPVARA